MERFFRNPFSWISSNIFKNSAQKMEIQKLETQRTGNWRIERTRNFGISNVNERRTYGFCFLQSLYLLYVEVIFCSHWSDIFLVFKGPCIALALKRTQKTPNWGPKLKKKGISGGGGSRDLKRGALLVCMLFFLNEHNENKICKNFQIEFSYLLELKLEMRRL